MTIQDLMRHTSGLVYGVFTSHAAGKEAYAKEGVDWDGVTPAEQIERLARVLRNGGQLARVRILGRAAVAQMSSDHLGDIRGASPILPRGYGFGLGFAVRKETGLNWVTGSAGEYRWGGAAGTAFWVDPKEQMIVVWMTQAQPGPRRGEDRDLFRQLVQAALVD